jgi:hypothetical protein
MRIKSTPCDCGASKHLIDSESMIEETIYMVRDSSVYYRVQHGVREVRPKSTNEAAKSSNL